MQTYKLQKDLGSKLFMLLAFSIFSTIMYQGHLKGENIYTILFIGALLLAAFQIASIFYVLFIKRTLELSIDADTISWSFFDNKKMFKQNSIKIDNIKDVKTEINYLTGNVYSTFQVTIKLKDENEVVLTDGLLYDFGLKQAEEICRYLLNNQLGDKQDVKFAKLINDLDIDLTKEQLFSKKDSKFNMIGIISKNKKEFLSLRLQIENIYSNYNNVKKNSNNEFMVTCDDFKNSYIYLRSNALGYVIEFNNLKEKEKIKMLKDMGRQKFSF
jgi:hypothetical protein